MKVRWTETSLRLRITPAELESLRVGKLVEERMALGSWCVLLQAGALGVLEAVGAELHLQLCFTDLETLLEPMAEGVYLTQGEFKYCVEKDFPCEHPRPVEARLEPTQTFPRPEQSS